jgi:hypothetical protein
MTDSRILEGLVTTLSSDGVVNIAPMGPRVTDAMDSFLLRPFATSRTLANLKQSGCGVLHVTDDVLLLAQAALGEPDPAPRLQAATKIAGQIISDACRWFEFEVVKLDTTAQRAEIEVRVVAEGVGRPFFGFNRAMFAVLEATILATRTHLIGADEIWRQVSALEPLVAKTAGPRERAAWHYVQSHLRRELSPPEPLDVGQ